MNRRSFLQGVTMVLTGMGIGAVAAAPEAPVLTPPPTPPRTLPQVPVLPPQMVIPPNTIVAVPGKLMMLHDGQWHYPDDCESCVNERIKIWIDAYLQTDAGKAEIAALAKELMGSV